MQAIPSRTPLSRTAFCTSSVMSVTVRPPAVRKRVSCWNTFIVAAILRESLPDAAGEPPHPQWILHDSGKDDDVNPGHALVVGGSGMLAKLCRALAADGWHVTVVGRDPEKLARATAGDSRLHPLRVDYEHVDEFA